jgi:hypothetical protein
VTGAVSNLPTTNKIAVMFIFKIILILFFAALAIGLHEIYKFIRAVSNQAKQMNKSAGNNSNRQSSNHRTYGDHETVVDSRDPEDANRKIISKEDGEYVDFTEDNGSSEQK